MKNRHHLPPKHASAFPENLRAEDQHPPESNTPVESGQSDNRIVQEEGDIPVYEAHEELLRMKHQPFTGKVAKREVSDHLEKKPTLDPKSFQGPTEGELGEGPSGKGWSK